MSLTETMLTKIPGEPLQSLHQADQRWSILRSEKPTIPNVIHTSLTPIGTPDWDVVICGGTLGILLGCALVLKGWRVALIEQGTLRGREQEWNISRPELRVLVDLGLLNESELSQAIATEYNPARIQFHEGPEFWVRDVLNLGIDPVFLLETLKNRFLAQGGYLLEHTPFSGATIHPDGVTINIGAGLTTRLLIDAMGHFSAIARQARHAEKPDAVCLVVGSCAQGFMSNETGDLLVSFTPLINQCQYFWEAFPARDGRSTYLFTYVDAHPDRPSLEFLYEEYLRLLPTYQKTPLENLTFKRALFGLFPCYRRSPLAPSWDRLLHVGDSSGNQSPLSFGGFGAMLRHLTRLTQGLDEALRADALDRQDLSLLQPYQPNLSVTWLFQRAMSPGLNQTLAPNQINELLSSVFQGMVNLGDPVLKPFLQDVVQFPGLSQTLAIAALKHPGTVAKVIPQVGVGNLLDWMRHFSALGLYSTLNPLAQSLDPWVAQNLNPKQQYYWHRWLQTWKYGSGGDFHP